jgi:hypothetical protein
MSFAEFPTELLLRVAILLPTFPYPYIPGPQPSQWSAGVTIGEGLPRVLRESNSVRSLSRTCRRFRDVLGNNEMLWSSLELGVGLGLRDIPIESENEEVGRRKSYMELERYLEENREVAEIVK